MQDNQKVISLDEKIRLHEINLKPDILITRKIWGIVGFKTKFQPRIKISNCDNGLDKRGFMRQSTLRRNGKA